MILIDPQYKRQSHKILGRYKVRAIYFMTRQDFLNSKDLGSNPHKNNCFNNNLNVNIGYRYTTVAGLNIILAGLKNGRPELVRDYTSFTFHIRHPEPQAMHNYKSFRM